MTQQPPQQGVFGPPPAYPAYPPSPPYPPAPGAAPPGPEFMAVDRYGSVVVDASGVAFEIRGAEAEFAWPEIHTVHYKATENGKALVVAVVLHDGQFYECEVTARPRERLREWFAGLQAVLGHYKPMR